MKRIISTILITLMVFSSVFVSNMSVLAEEVSESPQPDGNETYEHQGVVSLEGKKIMVVGNSMVYYGNCVIYGDQGEKDEGYLHQLIKQHDDNVTVIDHTYSGKKLDYIYDNYISKLSEEELDVDYLVLSEGNQYNDNLLGTVEKYLALFPEDVEFRFLRQPMMFESDLPCLFEGVQALRDNGYIVVDWGQMVYDIHSGSKEVPGAVSEFNRCSFMKENLGFKNGEGTVHASGRDGDRNHQNPLSGYITAQMLYSSLTNRSAVLTDYQFCYDIGIHRYFNIDNFAKIHYTDPENPTNFHKIFRSPQDMLGLQILIDEYLATEGIHTLTVQDEVKPTCTSVGFTRGSYCKICQKAVEEQTFIPIDEIGSHKLETTVGIAPTCTKEGKSIGISCELCGEVFAKSETIAPTGHLIKEEVTKATTSKDGKVVEICQYCDEVIDIDIIEKIKSISLYNSVYTYYGTVKNPTPIVTDTSGRKLKKDQDYTVTYPDGRIEIGDYKIKVTLKGNYKGSKELIFKIRPDGVKNLKSTATATTVNLTWDGVPKATKYRIYKYDSKSKTYKKVADTKNTSYKITGLSRGTKYKYRVRPCARINGTDYYSDKYEYTTAITKPKTAKITSVSSTKSKTALVKWKKVTNAERYEIICSRSKSFKNAKTVTVSSKYTKATIKGLSKGKKYYFKVRAYRSLSSVKVYGNYSNAKSKKIK
ncbi:MAG: fibronectin type III domain-containing protein [Ruminococcaceae bacterium]|nr:fibronectin type III domain-containing protein [Oscillospiraceae bacterium]